VKAAPPDKLIRQLKKLYPEAECALHYKTPYHLLVATILSAQCTDKRVNMVTPALFKKYPSAKEMAKARPENVEKLIMSTGFYRNKTKSLLGSAKAITEKHQGKIPTTMQELHALPGVGRKTANVVLGNAFGKPDGIVVDTHVARLSYRLGLTQHKDPKKIEVDLNKLFPKKYWIEIPHWLIHHGRVICKARKPTCEKCGLLDICPRKGLPKLTAAQKLKAKKTLNYRDLSGGQV